MSATSDLDFERGIVSLLPSEASTWGFRSGERGTHTSRTIMLDEITQLLAAVPGAASRENYADAVTAGNCLGKKTAANRRISLQHLKELYGLEPRAILFRVFRDLWPRHESSRPLLALLLALARDPLLRAAAAAVLRTPCGHELSRQPMKDALAEATGDRLNQDTLDKAVRNAASSWTQSGHLKGRGRKSRQRVRATPAAAAYALLLGFAIGRRGRLLFETPWAAVLDSDPGGLIDAAVEAKRLGLMDLKQSGRMIDVSFPAMFTEKEGALFRGPHRQAG